MKKSIKTILLILFLIIIIILYARFISTQGFKVNEYNIIDEKIPNSFNGVKIIHFSNIHFGRTTNLKTIENLVKEINILKPDIVIYTGDLYEKSLNISTKDKERIIKELNKIEVTIGKYAITGDSDKEDYINIMNETNFTILDNNSKVIYYNGTTPIKLTNNYENIEDIFTIGIIHKPDDIDNMKLGNINVVLAGHSLNGQIRIPFYGALIKKDGAKKYFDSYYQLEKTKFFISSGLGTENFSFRFFNKPSINLYRLSNY